MTNKELQDLFESITMNNHNVFDLYIELQKIEKDYNKSLFKKQTGFNVYEAYDIYNKNEGIVLRFVSLLSNPEDNGETLDKIFTVVAKMFDVERLMSNYNKEDKELLTSYLNMLGI